MNKKGGGNHCTRPKGLYLIEKLLKVVSAHCYLFILSTILWCFELMKLSIKLN